MGSPAGPRLPNRALLDANVLYPFGLRDCLLWIAWSGLFHPLWTDEILDEVRRNLVLGRRLTPEQAGALLVQMHRAFPEALLLPPRVRGDLEDIHPGDRHVVAAAIQGKARWVVTRNLRHFPVAALDPLGVRAVDADTFLLGLLDQHPVRVRHALERMAAARRRPPQSVEDALDMLAAFIPRFASAARRPTR